MLLVRELAQELQRTRYAPLCRPRHSLCAVAAAVVACGRMQRLAQSRRVTATLPSNVHNSSNTLPRSVASSSLRRLVEAVPLAATAVLRHSPFGTMPVVRLPPLTSLCNAIAPADGDGAVDGGYVLQELLALAELDVGAEENRVCFAADAPLGAALLLFPQVPVVRRATSHGQGRNFCRYPTVAQELTSIVGVVRRYLSEVEGKLQQKDASIQRAEEENSQLACVLEEREQLAAGFAQKLHDYEQHVAAAYVNRDVHRQLQQRLTEAFDALQQEREARRGTEDANAVLRQREVELTRAVQEMRDEVRSLSIELAERQQQPHGIYATSTPQPRYGILSHSAAARSTAASTPGGLYVPRSVSVPEATADFTDAVASGNRAAAAGSANNNTFEDGVGVQTGEALWRIIADIESRVARTGSHTPPGAAQT
ncbi:hypothetical protein DQ04_12851010 [Trypanosoma grayi]|uniref:hypothetical protein n=1 Tax=Trypanosoma grayi TaxID=71804 RepID=UPI0004F469DA|nr:hypothetical protein DQ04_12851010 [Trypanosoma grayi]KEG06661.1 hypothetical protein DQ04_12851010 [Trypanosoma grayi]